MGVYHTKCTKCGAMWTFISVTPMQFVGEPCECGNQYYKECDIYGNIIECPEEIEKEKKKKKKSKRKKPKMPSRHKKRGRK